MYSFLKTSRIAQLACATLAFLVVGTVGFYLGAHREGPSVPLTLTASLQTYTSEAIGISFEAPAHLGALQESVLERGECDPAILIDEDRCEHRYIGFELEGEPRWFLSAESALYSKHPLPREGSYEDTLASSDIEDYCSQGLYPLSCDISTNAHGLRVVKVGYSPACNGFEACSAEIFFVNFIETRNPSYPILAVWYDRTQNQVISDDAVDRMVDSIRLRD